MKRKFLTEKELKRIAPGAPCYVAKGTCLTPLAQEVAAQRQNAIIECDTLEEITQLKPYDKRLALGSYHQGRELQEKLSRLLKENDYLVCDCSDQSDPSPDCTNPILRVANLVQTGKAHRGILVDRDGIGSCIVANKIPGIRAAHCYDRLTAKNSREHHDVNLLVLAGPLLNPDLASLIVTTWLNTHFARGPNQKVNSLVEEVEKKFLRDTIIAIPGDCSCAL